MEIKVSIIVPVYNAENHIERCFDSIIAQDYPNWELIIIDDGSSDSSGDRCDRYSLWDKRIRVVHKPNGGVSSARNTGLKVCKGDYIGFMDSDDSLEPEFLESLYNAAIENDADIVCCNYYRVIDDEKFVLKKFGNRKINKDDLFDKSIYEDIDILNNI